MGSARTKLTVYLGGCNGRIGNRKQLDLSYGQPNLDLIAVQGIKFGLDNLVNASRCHLSGNSVFILKQ
jgi:hypothetical protein